MKRPWEKRRSKERVLNLFLPYYIYKKLKVVISFKQISCCSSEIGISIPPSNSGQ